MSSLLSALLLICFAASIHCSLSGSERDEEAMKEGKGHEQKATHQDVEPTDVDSEGTARESDLKKKAGADRTDDDDPSEKRPHIAAGGVIERTDSLSVSGQSPSGAIASASALADASSVADVRSSVADVRSSVADASSSETTEQTISFVPNRQTSMKEVLASSVWYMAQCWNEVRTTVVVNDFTIYHHTLSGNKEDHSDSVSRFVLPSSKDLRNPGTDVLGQLHANLWKFFLQALELPPLSGTAIVWTDLDNRTFRIREIGIFCEWYKRYFGLDQSKYTIAVTFLMRRGVNRYQRLLIDGRQIMTPLRTISDRLEFQFGRHKNLELYRQYLLDANTAYVEQTENA